MRGVIGDEDIFFQESNGLSHGFKRRTDQAGKPDNVGLESINWGRKFTSSIS
jgi:hypothetical protein